MRVLAAVLAWHTGLVPCFLAAGELLLRSGSGRAAAAAAAAAPAAAAPAPAPLLAALRAFIVRGLAPLMRKAPLLPSFSELAQQVNALFSLRPSYADAEHALLPRARSRWAALALCVRRGTALEAGAPASATSLASLQRVFVPVALQTAILEVEAALAGGARPAAELQGGASGV